MLRRVQILAGWVLALTFTLYRVKASDDSPVLHLNVWGRVSEFTFVIRPGTLATLELPAHFQGEPAGVLRGRACSGRGCGGNNHHLWVDNLGHVGVYKLLLLT